VLRPWKKLSHPQLGELEVGGLDPRVGLWNPPYERIDEVCRGQSAAFLRVAALAPSVRIASVQASAVGDGLFRLDARVENLGYLGTHGLSSARKLDWNEPLVAEIEVQGCALANPREARQSIGRLDGWGHGKYEGYAALYYMRSRGNTGERTVSWTLKGRGRAVIKIGSCRVGWISEDVAIG